MEIPLCYLAPIIHQLPVWEGQCVVADVRCGPLLVGAVDTLWGEGTLHVPSCRLLGKDRWGQVSGAAGTGMGQG